MEYLSLIFLHVTFGVLWAGGAVAVGLFIVPSVVEAGPGGGAVMAGAARRRLPAYLSAAGILTAITGARIYQLRFSTEWLQTPEGLVITLGALLALGALGLGLFVQRPTVMKIGQLAARMAAAGGPPAAEQAAELRALQLKLKKVAAVTSWHLIAATLLMAAHRMAALF